MRDPVESARPASRRPDPDDMPPLMSVGQTASILNDMSERTVRMLCKTGVIYAVKVGRQWRVNRDDLYRQYRIRSRFVRIQGPPAQNRGQAAVRPEAAAGGRLGLTAIA